LDGKVTHYYEWQSAGYLNMSRERGSMHHSNPVLAGLFFGFDDRNLYLRLDPIHNPDEFEPTDLAVHINIRGPQDVRICFPFWYGQFRLSRYRLERPDEQGEWRLAEESDLIRSNEIIELAAPLNKIGAKPGDGVRMRVHIIKAGLEYEQYPTHGSIYLTVPDDAFESDNWYV
jgi:hypothetical protein